MQCNFHVLPSFMGSLTYVLRERLSEASDGKNVFTHPIVGPFYGFLNESCPKIDCIA